MRRSVALLLTAVLVTSVARPVRADHEGGLLLGVLILPYVVMGGALVTALPFWAASAQRSGTPALASRPSGWGRIEAVWPDPQAPALLVHFDFGGYPPKGSRLGWEGRTDVLVFGRARPDDLFVRWDGLALWRSSPVNTGFNTELLAGVTVWPTTDPTWSIDWTGGFLGGVRWVYSTSGLRLLRLEAEALGVAFAGARAHGLDFQLELRAGLWLHWPAPLCAKVEPDAEARAGIGLAYRAMLPLGQADIIPAAHFLLLSAAF